MSKLIVLSILFATLWIPIAFARKPRPKRAFSAMLKWYVAFCGLYVFSLLHVIPYLH